MDDAARNSALLEINARVWLREQPWARERHDLALIPDAQLEEWASLGVEWIWMMGVWEPSPRSAEVCHAPAARDLVRHCWALAPEAMPGALGASPYAVRDYRLNPRLGKPREEREGGEPGSLARLKERLNARGLRLMLDFVPNHTAQDHPWTLAHPEYYVRGTAAQLEERPEAFFKTPKGDVLAMGKDPLFAPWTDTAQLNHREPRLADALAGELERIARQCDGVRCDMAMLAMSEVFVRTWPELAQECAGAEPGPFPEFWPRAIERVRKRSPGFTLLGEVYWDLEWRLLEMGFDYAYDKRLYDRLVAGDCGGVRDHLALAPLGFQNKLARFVENHDEERAQAALGWRHRAAAVLSAAAPGLRFMHEGQWEGRRIKVPVQLEVRPYEPVNEDLRRWYRRLLAELRQTPWVEGEFRVLEVREGSAEEAGFRQIIPILRSRGEARGLAVANMGMKEAAGFVVFGPEALPEGRIRLADRLSPLELECEREELLERGLYLDLMPGQCHLFRIEAKPFAG